MTEVTCMREKLMRFMYGRYGNDQLNRFMLILSVLLVFVSSFTGKNVFWYIGAVLITLTYIRMFSRNIQKRYAENQKYLQLVGPIGKWFKIRFKHLKERKTHRFFSCPACKQKVRVPKGKGNICITCPKCRTQFQKRS